MHNTGSVPTQTSGDVHVHDDARLRGSMILLNENPSIILLGYHCQLHCTAVAHANHLRKAVMLSYAMVLDHDTGATGGSS